MKFVQLWVTTKWKKGVGGGGGIFATVIIEEKWWIRIISGGYWMEIIYDSQPHTRNQVVQLRYL